MIFVGKWCGTQSLLSTISQTPCSSNYIIGNRHFCICSGLKFTWSVISQSHLYHGVSYIILSVVLIAISWTKIQHLILSLCKNEYNIQLVSPVAHDWVSINNHPVLSIMEMRDDQLPIASIIPNSIHIIVDGEFSWPVVICWTTDHISSNIFICG